MNTPLRLIILGVLTSQVAFCQEPGGYIMLDGKRYTEADLKKEMPDRYTQLRKEYEEKVVDALEDLVNQKVLEKGAKEAGQSVDEFVQKLREGAAAPSEKEVAERFDQLKKAGRLPPDAPESDLRRQLSAYMQQEAGQMAVQNKIGELKAKYRYDVPRVQVTVRDTDPVRLNKDAKVTIIEFTDYECPFCTRFQGTAAEIRAKYGDKIRWVFKDFPLSFHPNAMNGHVAGRCVQEQDKSRFWEFFDALFSADRAENFLEPSALRKLAGKMNLDLEKYDACVSGEKARKLVEESMQDGSKAGVNSTPSFFINGRPIKGALPFSEFDRLISAELGGS